MLLSVLLLALQPAVAQPDRFGLPACSLPNQQLAARSTFFLCFDSSLHLSTWAAHEITPQTLHGSAPRPSHFHRDPDLIGSARDSDFTHSGYSRGHLVPAAENASSEESIRATFLLSNAVPQIQPMNSSAWRRLENKLRLLAESADSIIIITGVLFESQSQTFIGASHIPVPSALYKVALVLHGTQKSMYAAIVPNSPDVHRSLDSYSVAVDELQHRTHLDFFPNLPAPEQHRLESIRSSLQ